MSLSNERAGSLEDVGDLEDGDVGDDSTGREEMGGMTDGEMIGGENIRVETVEVRCESYEPAATFSELETEAIPGTLRLTPSSSVPEYLWAHNDSGHEPILYAIHTSGTHRDARASSPSSRSSRFGGYRHCTLSSHIES